MNSLQLSNSARGKEENYNSIMRIRTIKQYLQGHSNYKGDYPYKTHWVNWIIFNHPQELVWKDSNFINATPGTTLQ